MNRGQIRSELGLLTILGVLLIFFLPVSAGPYSVVNGPATALRAAQNAHQLLLGIATVAQDPLLHCPSVFVLSWMILLAAELRPASQVGCDTTLRC
jgi:hypothetical protein